MAELWEREFMVEIRLEVRFGLELGPRSLRERFWPGFGQDRRARSLFLQLMCSTYVSVCPFCSF